MADVMDVIDVDRKGAASIVTLRRPDVRNALDSALLRALPEAMAAADADADTAAIVLTGADPAFCAGLDLRELGSTGANLKAVDGDVGPPSPARPWRETAKPVIAAVNGAAVTGGLELALQCDVRIASDRARFADTHARVGQLPGWGLSALLPRFVGQQAAIDMSLTGRFVGAEEAQRLGLVLRVVPHAELLPTVVAMAGEIAAADPRTAAALLAGYRAGAGMSLADALQDEAERAAAWRGTVSPEDVEARRQAIIERGRTLAGD